MAYIPIDFSIRLARIKKKKCIIIYLFTECDDNFEIFLFYYYFENQTNVEAAMHANKFIRLHEIATNHHKII